MKFGNPRMLWLLAVTLPLLIFFLWWAWRKKQALIAQFVQSRLLANLTVGVSKSVQKCRLTLLTLSVGLLMFVLAQPQWGFAWEEARQQGLDVVIGIDTSRSMLAADVKPNRLRRANRAALDLMRMAQNDRFGLVAFAGTAFLQCPLTLDEEAFRQSVNALDVGIIPQGGTAIAQAIESALSAFKDDTDNHRILVLFTDGEDHEEGVLEAAQKAADRGLRVFTIGMGTREGELLRIQDENGQMSYVKDDQGNVVKSRLNESLLTQIATAAQGFYLSLSGADTMEVLYRQGLEPLPRGELTSKLVKRFKEQFQWFLAAAILLLLIELLLPDRKMPPRPEEKSPVSSSARLAGTAALFLLLSWPLNTRASASQAQRFYEQGKYKEALQEYERLLESKANDPKLHYNAGASAYQSQAFDQAIRHFGLALSAPELDLQQQSFYNLGNSLYRFGERQQEPQAMVQAWEQSLKQYEAALKLNPQDADAQYNLDLVKKKLEELKQQQQQQQQQKSDSEENQDDSKENQENSQDSQQQDSKESDPSRQQEQQQNQPNPQSKEQEEQKQEQPSSAQNEQDKSEQEPPQPQQANSKEKSGSEQKESSPSGAVQGEMNLEQVQRLLDALKSEEKSMIFVPQDKAKRQPRIFKDW